MSYYTDIAMECVNSLMTKKENQLDFGCREVVVNIDSIKKEKMIGKPKGEYYLIDCPNLNSLAPVVYEYIIEQVSSYLRYKIRKETKKDVNKVLVICLGNENVVSDSLGAKVFEKLITTNTDDVCRNSLQAIKTSVLGSTGIETSTLAKSITATLNPDIVILIDSLCSVSTHRVGNSIQINDCGIIAGGAVGRNGKLINNSLLHCPTLAMGVPFVVRVETIIGDVLNMMTDLNLEDDLTINNKCADLLVTHKDIDKLVELDSFIIASAINMAVLDLSLKEQRIIKI